MLGDIHSKAVEMADFSVKDALSGDARKLRWNDIIEDIWTEAEERFRK